ncbi:MAG: multiheme c-type cytochrome [Bradymonadia bacterium]
MLLLLLLVAIGCEESTSGPAPLSEQALMDPEACKDCHPQQYSEWSGSMHAYAAADPVFTAMNARGQRETNGALGTFCVNCHAPMAVRLGLTTDGLNLDELPAYSKGVTCYYCHSVAEVNGTHNNPLTLATDGVFRAGIDDPVKTHAHESAYSPLHDRDAHSSSSMCGSCHDIVLESGLALERTYAEWQGTVYAREGDPQANSCGQCHMGSRQSPAALVEGAPIRTTHDHAMPAVDVALTPWPDREAQRAMVQELLDYSLLPEICVRTAPGGADVEVYLENIAAGHSFPSGAAHDRRVWVELTAYAGDEVLYRSGHTAEGTPAAYVEAEDESMWLLRDRTFDAEGETAHMFWEIASHEPELLPAPTALSPIEPEYINTHILRRYRVLGGTPDRIEMVVKMRPIGIEVLEDLVRSGDLDPAIIEAMPTFTLEGSRLTWAEAGAVMRRSPATGQPMLCVPDNPGDR